MRIGIIGGGPSGLFCALALEKETEIVEKASHPGGHASSFQMGGFTFDYGPHIMFSRDKEVLDFMVKSLGKNVHKCKRNNKISFRNRLIKWPFENDLKSLPLEYNLECLKGYFINPYKEKYKNPKNLKEWFLKSFGEGFCEHYFFPYNEKVWNLPIEKLSMIWSERIPNPDPVEVLKSAIGYETEGYKRQLYYNYPLRGGYQAISNVWSKAVNIRYNFNVEEVEIQKNGKVLLSDGSTKLEYDKLISTMPIWELCEKTNLRIPPSVKKAVDGLIANPMFIVSLGIKGKDQSQFSAIYFADSDFLVNRISFPGTFSPHNVPKGHYSIQADITFSKESSTNDMSDKDIIEHTINGLIEREIIDSNSDIVLKDVKRTDHSYVVYDVNYEKNVKVIRDWFSKQGIILVGRFSNFEYINVDGAIISATEILQNSLLISNSKTEILRMAESKILDCT